MVRFHSRKPADSHPRVVLSTKNSELTHLRLSEPCERSHGIQVPATGFEPVTSGLGNQRSIQLSYAGSFLKRYRGFCSEASQSLPMPADQ